MSSRRSCGCCSAALLTRMSSRPKASTRRATASWQNASSPMSPAIAMQRRPCVLDQALGRLGVLVLVEVDDRDVGALLGEGDRDRAADAAVAAGDQRDLAVELAGGPVVPHLGTRLRRHLPSAAPAAGPAPAADGARTGFLAWRRFLIRLAVPLGAAPEITAVAAIGSRPGPPAVPIRTPAPFLPSTGEPCRFAPTKEGPGEKPRWT